MPRMFASEYVVIERHHKEKKMSVKVPQSAEKLLEMCGTQIDLEFVRAASSGAVHILPPLPPDREQERQDISWADLADVFAKRHRMLCGTNLHLEQRGGKSPRVECFADDDLCPSCVRELGSQSARAFEHPQPGEELR